MKVSIKKLLASLLTVAMLASTVPVAFAADAPSFVIGATGDGTNGSFDGSLVTMTHVGGLGGKSEDDTAAAFVYDGYEPLAGHVRWKYTLSHIDNTAVGTDGTKAGIYFAFNMYASGDAIAWIGYSTSGYSILTWNPDGTAIVTGASGPISMERGKWHRVVISLNDSSGGHFACFVDGVRISASADSTWNDIIGKKQLMVAIDKNSGKGTVAFDDEYCAYWTNNATYSSIKAQDIAAVTDNEYLSFDASTNKVTVLKSAENVDILSETFAAAVSNETEIKLLTKDLSSEATTVDEAEVALIKTVGNAYHYYTLEKKALTDAEKMSIVSPKLTDVASTTYKDRIRILDDSIAVFSHTQKTAGYISSENLIESLVSDEGYSLSYVLEENGEDANVESVIGGYIKATKENADVIYIPIVKQTNKKILNMSAAGAAGSYDISNNGYGATTVTKSGIAGKASNDVAYGFIPNSSTAYPANGYRYNLNGHYDADAGAHKSSENTTFTYVFNAYADGNSVFAIYNGSTIYLKWTADGNVYFVSDVNNAMLSTPALTNVTRGQWHQFAITVESFSGRAILYVDGHAITDTSLQTPFGSYNAIGFGIDSYNSGSTTGKVLMDDAVYYEGFYYNHGEIIEAKSSTADFAVDTDAKVIYYQNMDLVALKTAVLANTDASAVKVYTDATIYAEAAELSAASVVFTTSENGMRYEYYTLKSYSEIPAPVLTITPSTTTYTVSTKYITDLTGYTLYAASYTSDNTLVSVTAYPVEADDLYKNLEFKLAYGDGGTKVKAFLWDDENTPLSFAEYNPGA